VVVDPSIVVETSGGLETEETVLWSDGLVEVKDEKSAEPIEE
jgi:hypothetical protein